MSAFSGQGIYEQWTYQLYNIVYTAFPIMFYALFDSQNTRLELLTNPQLYVIGLRSKLICEC